MSLTPFGPDAASAEALEIFKTPVWQRLTGILQLKPGLRFLDCVLSRRGFLFPVAGMLNGQGTFYSLEIHEGVLELNATKPVEGAAGFFSSVRLAKGRVERVPLPDDCLDRFFMVDVLPKLEKRVPFLREAHRLLSPGGMLCLLGRQNHREGEAPNAWMPEGEVVEALRSAGFNVAVSHAGFENYWCLSCKK